MPKFDKTFCSACGGEFGPGDHGFSHCKDHRSNDVRVESMRDSIRAELKIESLDDIPEEVCAIIGRAIGAF